jgi:hypothetical protein
MHYRVFYLRSARLSVLVQGEKKERWEELCAQAAVEQDGKKLLELVKQINELLEEKERRLGVLPSKPDKS